MFLDSLEKPWADALRAERIGDSAAYERFLHDLAESLRRAVSYKVTRMGIGSAAVEDVVQEVLIAVHSKRGQ